MPQSVYDYCDPQLFPKRNEILFSTQVLLTECIELPCSHPGGIESLFAVKAYPSIECSKVFNTPIGRKIYVRGCVEQEIMYTAHTPCQSVHTIKSKMHFRTFIEIPCTGRHSNTTLNLQIPAVLVEFAEAHLIDSREIIKSIILFVWYPNLCPPLPPKQITCSRQARGYKADKSFGCNLISYK